MPVEHTETTQVKALPGGPLTLTLDSELMTWISARAEAKKNSKASVVRELLAERFAQETAQ